MEREPDEIPEKPMPYGHGALLLGIRASDLLHDLCDTPIWSEGQKWQWVDSDLFSLHNWFSVQEKVPGALAEPTLGVDQVDEITGVLLDFNFTLPYDEAERSWLYAAYDAAYGPDSVETIRSREPEEIMSRGLRRVIDGRDLTRRWWAWRRETDEFRGQGGIELAREALRALIEMVAPGEELPKAYRSLQSESQ
ncbi:MAG TPA: hypothetical protein VHW67_05720 [Solirubrobacteraceae bacterium]|jgi:hypothetical protein|nr:hypothetical protein [Solirubrobacteraceae bacterium]